MKRIGRWTYNSDSTKYGEAGWHLDGGPVVIDWMPDHNGECPHSRPCRGEYQLHNWPEGAPFAGSPSPVDDHHSVACSLREAMAVVEQEHDELVLTVLAGESHA